MTVRVRIAPSPTGDPHVGTAYIALVNYCFARKHGGQFILRIEDTDQSRCSESSKQAIFDSLKWLGLSYDEGPDVGGDRGPYVQSERVAAGIYQGHVDRLIAQGDAYRCFCTTERLAALREEQKAAKATFFGYDRHCRDLDPAESQRRADAGETFVVRMKAPLEGEFAYQDRLRKNPFTKQWAEIDDQVLLKSDGWPTYHLAAVVDDHEMGISHVIRAEEWLNSLPKHVWLNEKLGFTAPEYVHVGLLRNPDGSKISKRKNPTNILWYKQRGFVPAALCNFLATLGHSHPDELEKFDLDELIRIFDLDRLNVAGPVFDMQKLEHLQGLYFRELDDDAMVGEIHRCIDERIHDLLPLLRERMVYGGDLTHAASFFYTDHVSHSVADLVPKGWDAAQTKKALEGLRSVLNKAAKKGDLSWDSSWLETTIRGFGEAKEYKPKQLFMPLRVVASGRRESPPLFDTIALVGRLAFMQRLEDAILALR
ncbi:MAG: glutamate--tRNA ligase [Planctomycetota bacterium]|jgi:glutamyl-tRNA synthetase|nr:glutamate--tRNA ligase [Planctomycetota bacterium]